MEYYHLSFPFIPAYVRFLFTASHESSYHRPGYCRQLLGMGAETARSGFYDCRPSHCGNGIPRSRRTGESADRPRLPARVAAGGVSFRPFLLLPGNRAGTGRFMVAEDSHFPGSWKPEDQLEIWQERQTAPESCSYAGPLFPWPEHWEGKGQAAYTRGSGVLHVETMVNAMRRFFSEEGRFVEAEVAPDDIQPAARTAFFTGAGTLFHILCGALAGRPECIRTWPP